MPSVRGLRQRQALTFQLSSSQLFLTMGGDHICKSRTDTVSPERWLGGCNESKTDNGAFDSSRLPRVSGAKVKFSPARRARSSRRPSAATADTLGLSSGIWRLRNTSRPIPPIPKIRRRDRVAQERHAGAQRVYHHRAAQNNATSVIFRAAAQKKKNRDLPFH